MDREKVINGLTEILNFFDIMSAIEGRCNELKQDAENAIDFLKEQEAVEPYVTGNGESFETAETWWYECGNCNKPIDPNDKFCRHCGKAVKWE